MSSVGMTLRPKTDTQQEPSYSSAFERKLKSEFRMIRLREPATANFAAIEVMYPNGTNEILYAFNAGCGAQHSEEFLTAKIRALPSGTTILSAFSDRSLCGACQRFFLMAVGSKGCKEVVFAVSNTKTAAEKAAEIKKYWGWDVKSDKKG